MKSTLTLLTVIAAWAGAALAATTTPTTTAKHQPAHHARRPVATMKKTTLKPTKPLTRTWQSGPASLPPQTEIMPNRPAAYPPRISGAHVANANAASLASAGQHPSAIRVSTVTVSSTFVGPKLSVSMPEAPNPVDPETQRVQSEFARLRQDETARRAFYDDLLGTVARVRAGNQPDDAPVKVKSVSYQPDATPMEKPSVESAEPVNPAGAPVFAPPQPTLPPPAPPTKLSSPQSLVGPYGNHLDPVAYQRVVRWAQANDVPISLALGVAWMESRMTTNAPRGTSGEVGMFQIMPERCRLEGFPSERLVEPEFNAWLGTRLLAQYYREEGSVARAAAKYVAGPGVFNRKYSKDMWDYITWYANTVDSYASYFSQELS